MSVLGSPTAAARRFRHSHAAMASDQFFDHFCACSDFFECLSLQHLIAEISREFTYFAAIYGATCPQCMFGMARTRYDSSDAMYNLICVSPCAVRLVYSFPVEFPIITPLFEGLVLISPHLTTRCQARSIVRHGYQIQGNCCWDLLIGPTIHVTHLLTRSRHVLHVVHGLPGEGDAHSIHKIPPITWWLMSAGAHGDAHPGPYSFQSRGAAGLEPPALRLLCIRLWSM